MRAGRADGHARTAIAAWSPAAGDRLSYRWRTLEGPYFDNQVGTLHIDGRRAAIQLDKTVPGEDGKEALEETFCRRIA